MSANQSSSAPEPRVLVHCPDGKIMWTSENPEVSAAMVTEECARSIIPVTLRFSNAEREFGANDEETIDSLACQLDQILKKMERLQKEKEEIMEKIRARGGQIQIPKN
ncbi:hypothetical protein BFJ68_g429 [Fusarium oxysporum]|uniref:Uncharacterized protein n=2 Tax=Fusarium oxysporum TaxID=5507 RepID=A0A420S9D2_FUSOX|nr:hypothetical protein BFJ65_g11674 [Fusarium oxysporum f. sp. cepae]RKK56091.1 hypothetical protein BFJ66_g3709 [Fusarium oxysporum f. sp. cepae]RKK59974.1 hypothetical protein BFJ67_g2308 [Fusarium oxysporum f. sp. cepae]RKL01656.1 hypothetical protein BFJ71_g4983 [Fusarium oxysporum]RKL25802.1 hypothetical protein BFJ68_g429 [Fusarium oxysporum]